MKVWNDHNRHRDQIRPRPPSSPSHLPKPIYRHSPSHTQRHEDGDTRLVLVRELPAGSDMDLEGYT